MNFTKGPWATQLKGSDDYSNPDGEYEWEISYDTRDGLTYPIADIIAKLEYGTSEANANLIAASPDMYEALKELLRFVRGNGKREHHNLCYGEIQPHPDCQLCKSIAIEKVASQALAKAEGSGE